MLFACTNSLHYSDILSLKYLTKLKDLSSDVKFTSDLTKSSVYLEGLKSNFYDENLLSILELHSQNLNSKKQLDTHSLGISNACILDLLFTLLQLKDKQTWTHSS